MCPRGAGWGRQLGELWRLLQTSASPSRAPCSAGRGRIPCVNKESPEAEKSGALSSLAVPSPRFPVPLLLCHSPLPSLLLSLGGGHGGLRPTLTVLSLTNLPPAAPHPPPGVYPRLEAFLLLLAPPPQHQHPTLEQLSKNKCIHSLAICTPLSDTRSIHLCLSVCLSLTHTYILTFLT